MEVNGTADEDPRNKSSNNGVMIIPRKLPKAELKIAAASFPPTALVRITADDTGGGIQPTVCKPFKSHGFIDVKANNLRKNQIALGKNARVKVCTNMWSLTCIKALVSSSVFKESPLLKNIVETAT